MKLLFITLTILESLFSTLSQKTLDSDFNISLTSSLSQPMTYKGHIVMFDENFKLNMLTNEASYDGKTFYLYSADTEELTLSIPTEQELLETNPLLYAKALSHVCHITERKAKEGAETIITLTPKDLTAGVERFTLRVNTATLLPISVEIKESNQTTFLKLTNPKYISTAPDFVLRKDGAYINDLR